MDAFYASCEQRDDPSLRGKPVAVGGSQRGVVAAASYEARVFGVRSAMPMTRARRLCPSLVVVPPDFQKYHAASEQVFAIFHEVTKLVEPLSLDEAFLDVTENAWNEPLGRTVALRIKQKIREVTGLTASAGVAPNKFLAKIASGWKKPDGLTVIAPQRVEKFLMGLDVGALWGVGPKTEARLKEIGVTKVTDVRTASLRRLREVVGSFAETLVELAHGRDERPVVADRRRRSIGSENTFPEDLLDLSEIRSFVESTARELAPWLVENQKDARTVTLKVRYSNFETITRSDTRDPPTRSADAIAARALALIARTEAGKKPVRLLGVSLHDLKPDDQEPEEELFPGKQLLLPFPEGESEGRSPSRGLGGEAPASTQESSRARVGSFQDPS
jgi:DNA polymerase-4